MIQALRERLAAHEPVQRRDAIQTFAIPLRAGAVHEWLGGEGSRAWSPPLCILIDLARRAATPSATHEGAGLIAWIGRPCQPHVLALIGRDSGRLDDGLLRRSIFVDAPDAASRLWAIDAALRSPSVAAVVADGRSLDMAATRRLQLAAESSGCVALLARPLSELKVLSAACTRWVVRPDEIDTGTRHPGWNVELVRSKGLPPMGSTESDSAQATSWRVEWDHVACALVASSVVEHRTRQTAAAAPGGIRLTG